MIDNKYVEGQRLTRNKVTIHELINFDDGEEKPKVSIIVPVCNVELYLEECLQSLEKQTLKEIEIICINDGSTDNSLSILKKYAKKDKKFKVIDKDNAGYGHAMNIGMDMAKGKYIGIVESDDFTDVHMFEDLFELAEKEKLEVVKADFNRFVKEDGELVCNYIEVAARDRDCYNKVINPQENTKVFELVMQTWSGIYKRDFLVENGIRHHETPGASYQDNGFWFQTFMFATRVYFYNKAYYFNRRDIPNSSVYNKEKVYVMNKEYEFIKNKLDEYPDLKERFIYQYSRKKYLNYVFTYNRLAEEYKMEYLSVFNKEIRQAEADGEIDWELFLPKEKAELELILKRPEEYLAKNIINKLKREKKDEIKKIKSENHNLKIQNSYLDEELRKQNVLIYDMWNSTSYKIGRGLTEIYRTKKDKKIRQERRSDVNKVVHLVYITDENYCLPTGVALTSLKKSKFLDSIYKVHIFASELSKDNKQRLSSLQREDFIVDIIDVEQDERFKSYTKRDGDLHVSPAAILKFKIPAILSNVGKVLYMDGDVLVQDDLLELYNLDIKGKYAAVVKDILSERNPKHLQFLHYPYKYYFNSGMMLMNLTKMRKDNITDKLVDYRINGINHFMDQDALNVVLGQKICFVNPKYNFLNKFYDWWDAKQLSAFYGVVFPDTEVAAFKQAAILHLGSHEKPWKYEMGYLSELYDYYHKQSPYKDFVLKRDILPSNIK